MTWDSWGRPVNNSRLVRDVDPRSSRDLWALLLLVTIVVAALVLYAWPHYQIRQSGHEAQRMERERETLLEENRKLQLEKAALEDLRRVEVIASRDLELGPPPPERVIVVEAPTERPDNVQLASADRRSRGEEN
jgi:cell division protein FtsL